METELDEADSLLRGIVGATATVRRPLARGEVVAERFVVEHLAGAGGMGTVYRAIDRANGGPVAVKVMQSGGGERERFVQEARVLAQLSHPSIVRYVAHGPIDDERVFIAMEWLEGADLARMLDRARLSITDAITIVRRAAEGLAIAHRRGIVHRDVKPSNLFLVADDPTQLRVLDFGVARLAASRRALTKTGAIVGTIGYMAPEQATGERDLDARADVFALGCVLFECLTGEPAFAAEHPVAILAKILCDEAPRVSTLRSGVPAELDELVARMLSKDRGHRPPDADALAGELERIVPVEAAPPERARLKGAEQRLVCVILVSGTRDVDTVAASFGAETARLADGTYLLTHASHGDAATDHAARMASLALAVRDAHPSSRIALAIGRAETSGRHPVGPAIDRAAALLGGAPGTLRVDAVAASLLDTRFELREGALVARRDTEAARTLLGKPTPCVGRDKELALLDATLAECVGDSVARAVLVTAAPGVGKSRLRREFVRRAGQTVWLVQADPVTAGSSLALVRQLVRSAGVGDDEFLRELVGEPSPAPSPRLRAARSDPALMGDRMRHAFEDWLAAACATRPIAIVLEDLHWADAASVEYLSSALRSLRDRPLFVLTLARPEVHELFPRLWSEAGPQEIRLGGLTRRAAERLVREVLGESVTSDTLARIVERADGNAYYLEELIRRISEGGGDDALPETILAMIESRLARLEPEARHVLRAASVYGEVFWQSGVAALLGGDARAGEWLRALADRELVEVRREARFAGETEYAFRHALLRDASYAMLVDTDRATAHRLAADWLESAGEKDAFVLADHFEHGGDRPRAVTKFQLAVKQAYRASDMATAIHGAERGLALAPPPEIARDLNVRRSSAHWFRGEVMQSVAAGEAALDGAPPYTPDWYRAVRSVFSGFIHRNMRARWQAVMAELGQEPPQAVIGDHARTLMLAAAELLHVGELAAADRFIAWLTVPLARAGDVGKAALAAVCAWRGLFCGDLAAAQDQSTAAIQGYEQIGLVRDTVFPRFAWCCAAIRMGQTEDALRELESDDERWALAPLFQATRRTIQAIARCARGEYAEALQAAARAIALAQPYGSMQMLGLALIHHAQVAMEAGALTVAEQSLEQAHALTREIPPYRASTLVHEGQLRLLSGEPERALECVDEGARISRVVGGGWCFDARDSLVRVLALRRLGRAAEAEHALAVAIGELERGAAHLSREARSGFLDSVPVHAALMAGAPDGRAIGQR